MITIIHGDDTVTSRKFFLEIRQKIDNPFTFEGERLNLSDLVQIFEGAALFAEHKEIFIEDFFSKRKSAKEVDEIVNLVQKNLKVAQVYFWEGKELSKIQLSLFKNSIIKTFKHPQALFLFLDAIKPNNGRNLIALFHKALENSEKEIIFYMLIRQFRILLALSDPSTDEQIDEIRRLVPWQKSKMQKQAGLFSLERLKERYKKLHEIDLAQKTGTLNLSLEQSIDMFLISL